jgi:hypothetical protein
VSLAEKEAFGLSMDLDRSGIDVRTYLPFGHKVAGVLDVKSARDKKRKEMRSRSTVGITSNAKYIRTELCQFLL